VWVSVRHSALPSILQLPLSGSISRARIVHLTGELLNTGIMSVTAKFAAVAEPGIMSMPHPTSKVFDGHSAKQNFASTLFNVDELGSKHSTFTIANVALDPAAPVAPVGPAGPVGPVAPVGP